MHCRDHTSSSPKFYREPQRRSSRELTIAPNSAEGSLGRGQGDVGIAKCTLGTSFDAAARASSCNNHLCPSSHHSGVTSTPNDLQGYHGITKCITWWSSVASFKGVFNTTSITTANGRPLLNSNLQLRFRNATTSHLSVSHYAPVLTCERRLGFQTTLTPTINDKDIHTFHTGRVN